MTEEDTTHDALTALEHRTVRLRSISVAVLFVLLLLSFLTLGFTIATAVKTANIIKRAVAVEAARGRELTEARKSVDQIRDALTKLEVAAGIALPAPVPQATPGPSPPGSEPSNSRNPSHATPSPSPPPAAPSPAPTPTPSIVCILQFCV